MTTQIGGASRLPIGSFRYNSLTDVDLMSNVDYLSKELYKPDKVEDLTIMDHPFMGMISKSTDFVGHQRPVNMIYGRNQGVSRGLAEAQGNRTGHKGKRVQLTRVRMYATAELYTEDLRSTAHDAGAFMELMTEELDSTYAAAAQNLANQLFRKGYGILADCTIDSSGAEITLVHEEDAVHIDEGMRIDLITEVTDTLADDYTPTNATVRTPLASYGFVQTVDRDAGTFTINVSTDIATTYTGTLVDTANAYKCGVALNGDAEASGGALLVTRVAGLQGWLPTTAPGSSDNWFFMNRSADPQRLAGIRYDAENVPLEEALQRALSKASRFGGKPKVAICHPERYTDLAIALGIKAQYTTMGSTGVVGYDALKVHGPKGSVSVVADQDCPVDQMFLLDMRYWELASLGELIGVINDGDGLEALRSASKDSYEWRIGGFFNAFCKAPGHNVVMYNLAT